MLKMQLLLNAVINRRHDNLQNEPGKQGMGRRDKQDGSLIAKLTNWFARNGCNITKID